jgi:TM2 domain-containing membrane protein YozV
MYCQKCGSKNLDYANFCQSCGTDLRGTSSNFQISTPFTNSSSTGKSPFLACVLSLVIVGLGQFYNGDIKKGAFMLIGAIIGGALSFSFLWWIMAIWSAIDAYNVADGKKEIWR